MTAVARIAVNREKGRWYEIPRDFKIILDGHPVARISPGGQVAFDVAAGQHTVTARIDGLNSRTVQLDLAEHDQAHLTCELTSYLRGFFAPWLCRYIDLHVQADDPAS